MPGRPWLWCCVTPLGLRSWKQRLWADNDPEPVAGQIIQFMYQINWDGNEEHISQHSGKQPCPSSETPQAADSCHSLPSSESCWYSLPGWTLAPPCEFGQPLKASITSMSLNFFICVVGTTASTEQMASAQWDPCRVLIKCSVNKLIVVGAHIMFEHYTTD